MQELGCFETLLPTELRSGILTADRKRVGWFGDWSTYPMAEGEYMACMKGEAIELVGIRGVERALKSAPLVATIGLSASAMGRGEFDSDIELMPDVLEESVPLLRICPSGLMILVVSALNVVSAKVLTGFIRCGA